jgi:hypothetical protein
MIFIIDYKVHVAIIAIIVIIAIAIMFYLHVRAAIERSISSQ